jgi:hypothetical protein
MLRHRATATKSDFQVSNLVLTTLRMALTTLRVESGLLQATGGDGVVDRCDDDLRCLWSRGQTSTWKQLLSRC